MRIFYDISCYRVEYDNSKLVVVIESFYDREETIFGNFQFT